ncbi:MAG TPA: M56 family metallopeptidase [Bryobacteraceae bacterium]|nr:M56 family metallopeptidase [Bryobacteraceae bacterium]
MTQLAWLGEIAWKGSVILVMAFAAAALLSRAAASARHLLWTAALGTLLALPLAIVLAPQWKVAPPVAAAQAEPVPGAPIHSSAAATTARLEIQPFRYSWLLLWTLGCFAASLRFAAGTVRTRSIVRRAGPANYAEPAARELASALGIRRAVRVIETVEAPVPIACGILRPAIVLPRGAAAWTEARLRTVLLHELAHIRRYDLAAQAVGQAACCLYWFHPLAWIAARQLRQERERACDDAVLASGIPAHDYAEALVDLARSLAARGRGWSGAPAMAEACDVESRIRALFDRRRNRGPVRAATAAAIGAAALALLLPVASLTLQAQADRGVLAGVVQDPSGARVPFCYVVAKNRDGSNQEVTKANAAGEYRFGAIPAGSYALEFASPGFAPAKVDVRITSGQAARLDAKLEMGTVSERITISGQKPPVPMAAAGVPVRVRVGGNVQPLRLLVQTKPAYPSELQQAGVEGTVVIRAVISKEGDVLSPQVVNTDVDPRLAQLALDAVKRWRYQSSLLNGEPVETSTTMTIDFTLEQ